MNPSFPSALFPSPAPAASFDSSSGDFNDVSLSPPTTMSGLNQRRAGQSQPASATAGDFGFGGGSGGHSLPSQSPPTTAVVSAVKDSMTLGSFVHFFLRPRFLVPLVVLWALLSTLAFPLLVALSAADPSNDIGSSPSMPTPDTSVFCPSPGHSHHLSAVQALLPPWQPSCIPCPEHAECRDDGILRCFPMHTRVWHDCVSQADTHLVARDLKEKAIGALDLHAGRVLCGEPSVLAPSVTNLADLTIDELRQLSLPATIPAVDRVRRDREWALTAQWLESEATHASAWNRRNPFERLLLIHDDSRQPKRYRSVYPVISVSCRLRLIAHATPLRAAGWGLLIMLLLLSALLVRVVSLYFSRASAIRQRICAALREDCYYDYDRRLLIHQPQALQALQAEHAPPSPAASNPLSAWVRDAREQLRKAVWFRVISLMTADAHIESGSRDFQYGRADAWRWIGPPPESALREHADLSADTPVPSSGRGSALRSPLSASRSPQRGSEYGGDDADRHMHDL